MKKIADIALKAIDYATVVFLILLAGVFALLAFVALVFTFVDGDVFNLIGTAAGSFLAWVTWTIKEDIR
jgi:hypothetical protein